MMETSFHGYPGDDGEYGHRRRPQSPYQPERPQRTKGDRAGDFLTWCVRALIPAICWLAYQQNMQMQALQLTLAKVSMAQDYQNQQLTKHSQDIESIWRELHQRNEK